MPITRTNHFAFVVLSDDENFQEEHHSEAFLESAEESGDRLYAGTTRHDMKVVEVLAIVPPSSTHSHFEVQKCNLHTTDLSGKLFLVGYLSEGPLDDYYHGHENYLTITDVFDNEDAAKARVEAIKHKTYGEDFHVLEFN